MKILVTGGKGAIGSRLMARLAADGHQPLSYDLLDGQNLFNLEQLESAVKSVDAVYHLAAEANLNNMRTLEGGRDGVLSNVGATDNVAYLCTKHAKWLLFVSTMCVYGDVKAYPIQEDATLPNPSEIYGASKYAAEWIVRGYGSSLGLSYTILRVATVYGPGCRPELGVHVFLRQALKNKPITVHGDGSQERTLTYIDDVVEGLVAPLAHKRQALGQIFNITGVEHISALYTATQIKEITRSSSPIQFIPQRPYNTIHEEADASKAKKFLDWEARVPFAQGLEKTLAWMRTPGHH